MIMKQGNTEKKKDNTPRGVRNCNPGNIRLPKEENMMRDKFEGEIRPSRDKSFRTFAKMAYGYRAMHVVPLVGAWIENWLRYPDMLFRRVRDEHGDLRLSQRASMFHPGKAFTAAAT